MMIHWLLVNGWHACGLIPLLGERAAGDRAHVTCPLCLETQSAGEGGVR